MKVILKAFYNCPADNVHRVYIIPENEMGSSPPVKECPVCLNDMEFIGTEKVTTGGSSPIPYSQTF